MWCRCLGLLKQSRILLVIRIWETASMIRSRSRSTGLACLLSKMLEFNTILMSLWRMQINIWQETINMLNIVPKIKDRAATPRIRTKTFSVSWALPAKASNSNIFWICPLPLHQTTWHQSLEDNSLSTWTIITRTAKMWSRQRRTLSQATSSPFHSNITIVCFQKKTIEERGVIGIQNCIKCFSKIRTNWNRLKKTLRGRCPNAKFLWSKMFKKIVEIMNRLSYAHQSTLKIQTSSHLITV